MDDNSIEIVSTWSTPIFVVQLPEHDEIREDLLPQLYAVREEDLAAGVTSGVAPTAKRNMYESELDLLDRDIPCFEELRYILEDLVLAVAEQVNGDFWDEHEEYLATVTESWCHITQYGGYHDVHSHPNCSWCGIYYLDVGDSSFEEQSGINRFYDPRPLANHFHDAGTLYLDETAVWDFDPLDGQVIVFPSYVKHSALPYFGSSDRVVIAFNCEVNPVEYD